MGWLRLTALEANAPCAIMRGWFVYQCDWSVRTAQPYGYLNLEPHRDHLYSMCKFVSAVIALHKIDESPNKVCGSLICREKDEGSLGLESLLSHKAAAVRAAHGTWPIPT